MPETESSFLSDDPDQSLTVLEEFLTRFLLAWETDPPPDLCNFLPETGAIRRLTLAELIKVDLEYRWRVHKLPKRLEEYCREFPELLAGGIPPDLVYEEFHILKQAGEKVDAQEYLTAFPDQDTEIACLLGLDQEYASTALYKDAGKAQLADIEPGQILDDFELLARLGAGAFAQVYLARQISMQRMVAVKISSDHGTEPQTLAQLDHNHIVRVYDQRPLSDRGLRLLYMQYVAGGTLQAVVRELREGGSDQPTGEVLLRAVDSALDDRGETRPGESRLRNRIQNARWDETVCWIGSRLGSALEYAHGLGVLHRDIKPANVLLTSEGMPQLADFNISFSSKLDGASPAAYFGGSLAYMSPEQLEAYSPAYDRQPDTLDGRSDLYSLGVLLWELLTGRRPFHDTKSEAGPVKMIDEMIERRRNGPPEVEPPAWVAPRILDVLRKCLSLNPDDRFQSGGEFAAQLELCRHPKAHDLLVPPKDSLRRKLVPWSGLIVMLILMAPNVAAGIFNFAYNDDAMKRVLPDLSYGIFQETVMVINSLLYPIGLGWAFLRPYRIWRQARDPDADVDSLRARTLGARPFCRDDGRHAVGRWRRCLSNQHSRGIRRHSAHHLRAVLCFAGDVRADRGRLSVFLHQLVFVAVHVPVAAARWAQRGPRHSAVAPSAETRERLPADCRPGPDARRGGGCAAAVAGVRDADRCADHLRGGGGGGLLAAVPDQQRSSGRHR